MKTFTLAFVLCLLCVAALVAPAQANPITPAVGFACTAKTCPACDDEVGPSIPAPCLVSTPPVKIGPTIPPSPWDDDAPTLVIAMAKIPHAPVGVGPTIPPCQWDKKWCDDCWDDWRKCF